jgi:hypothetical protein
MKKLSPRSVQQTLVPDANVLPGTGKINEVTSQNINGRYLIGVVFLFSVLFSSAQEEEFLPHQLEINVGGCVSGNGYGVLYSSGLTMQKREHSFGLSVLVQKRTLKPGGLRFQYCYKYARSYSGRTDCEFFGGIQYINKLPMSFNMIRIEEMADIEHTRNWNETALSAVEFNAGFGFTSRLNDYMIFKNYIGIGPYYHTTYTKGMYHERIEPVLLLGTCLSFIVK